MSAAAIEYNVVRFDADSTDSDLNQALGRIGADGWKLASSYHLHHLNTVVYVFLRETAAAK